MNQGENEMKGEFSDMIKTLESISNTLDKICNDEINFNNEMSQLLEQMSWETYKHAQDLKVMGEYF